MSEAGDALGRRIALELGPSVPTSVFVSATDFTTANVSHRDSTTSTRERHLIDDPEIPHVYIHTVKTLDWWILKHLTSKREEHPPPESQVPHRTLLPAVHADVIGNGNKKDKITNRTCPAAKIKYKGRLVSSDKIRPHPPTSAISNPGG
jgi:hypothetical protein